MKEKIELVKFIITRFDNYIESSQTKTNIYLAIHILIIGGIPSVFLSNNISINDSLNLYFLLGIMSLSLISFVMIIYNLNPFLKSTNKDFNSIFFFLDVEKYKSKQYAELILDQNDDKLFEDISRQAHSLAKGLKRKYTVLKLLGPVIILEVILIFIWTINYIIK